MFSRNVRRSCLSLVALAAAVAGARPATAQMTVASFDVRPTQSEIDSLFDMADMPT